ncbi:MAG: autotransporter-associated beta strand repeat-containing protein, partial [Pseudomonadota bacterium]
MMPPQAAPALSLQVAKLMNKTHRTVWNAALASWIAAPELARGRHKGNGKPGPALCVALSHTQDTGADVAASIGLANTRSGRGRGSMGGRCSSGSHAFALVLPSQLVIACLLSLQAPTVFAAGCSAPSDATLASCIANAGSGDTVTVTNSSISGTSNLGTLSAGATLIVGGNSAADTITAATLYMNGGTIRAAGDTTFSSSFDMAANTANTFAAAAGKSLLLSGPVNIHGNTTLTYGSTTDTGTVSLLLNGGTIARGAFVVAGGTLVGLNNNFAVVLGFANSTTVDAGATLRDASNAPALTIRNLQGSGTVDSSGKPYQINAGNFSGMLIGTGGLTKGGATTDTLILSGANTYTGGTTITAGTVQVGNGGASGTLGTGAVIDDAILAFDRSDLVTVANAISGTGSVTQAGSGTTVLTGTNNYTGGTTVNAGALVAGSADAFTQNSAYTVNGGSLGLGNWNLTASSLSGAGGTIALNAQTLGVDQNSDTSYAGSISGSGSLIKSGIGMLTLIGTNTYSGGTTISAGTLQVGNGGTAGTLGAGAVVDNAALAFNRSDFMTVANAISGSGNLTQAGSGTTVLTGTNTYTGGTIVGAGTLRAGSSGAFVQSSAYTVNGGSLDLGSWDLTASSLSGTGGAVQLDAQSLVVNQASNTGYAGTITGSGSLVKGGAGSLSLTGPNTYSGTTTINAGTLQVGDGGTTGTLGTGAVVDNAALVFNRSDLMTVANAISGSGDLMQAGSGTLNLTGANTYTGGTSINAGTLKVNNTSGSATGTGA